MANTNLLVNNFRNEQVNNLINSITSNNDIYYFFVGDHVPHSNSALQTVNEDVSDTRLTPYAKMIMGKKVKSTDIMPVIRNIPWSSQIFDMYDQSDVDLASENFFCMVNEGSFYHVWKCLDNNNNANSTVAPSFAAGATSLLYQTSDGYRWKYMSSVASNTVNKFSTSKVFPCVANTSVSAIAQDGLIKIIKIDANQQGAYYNNYIDGTLVASDIKINGNPTLFNISTPGVQAVNGYYTGCIIYITSGVGVGQFAIISDYVSNSTGNIFKTANSFPITPTNGTTYQIRPQVNVITDGTESISCVARALVNSFNTNSIYRIEVLQYGLGITNASAVVVANSVVGVNSFNIAVVRPILAPYGGHGSDIFNELYCNQLEFSVSLSNTENNTISTQNQYQQIGLIRDPQFQNVQLTLTNTTASFTNNETILVVSPETLVVNATCNTNNNQISANLAFFLTSVVQGEQLIIQTSDGHVNQLVNVSFIVNNQVINCTSNATFSCTNLTILNANVIASAVVSSITNTSLITVTNCSPLINNFSIIIGQSSGAYATVSSMKRNNVIKGFDTFVQLYKYDATLNSGVFINNEIVFQGNNSAYVHHVDGAGPAVTIFLSGMTRLFQTGQNITGNTSGASATLNTIYSPEVIPGSGAVSYVENITPVIRSNTQSEQFQIIVNF